MKKKIPKEAAEDELKIEGPTRPPLFKAKFKRSGSQGWEDKVLELEKNAIDESGSTRKKQIKPWM